MTSFVPATKDLQRQWRSRLFFHLDGLALSGVVPVLDVSGVLEEVLQTGGDVDELASLFGANPGYLNVGLRMLCSQGILDAHYGEDKVTYVPHKDADVVHWARDRHLYALGRSWLEHSVGMWNRPQEPLSAEALSVMREAWPTTPQAKPSASNNVSASTSKAPSWRRGSSCWARLLAPRP